MMRQLQKRHKIYVQKNSSWNEEIAKILKDSVNILASLLYKVTCHLKLVPAIFYQMFLFSPNGSPSKTEKCFLFHLKSSFCS